MSLVYSSLAALMMASCVLASQPLERFGGRALSSEAPSYGGYGGYGGEAGSVGPASDAMMAEDSGVVGAGSSSGAMIGAIVGGVVAAAVVAAAVAGYTYRKYAAAKAGSSAASIAGSAPSGSLV